MSETPRSPRRPRLGSLLGRIGLALVLVATVLLIAEAASRWLVPDPSVHLGFARDRVLEPYTMFGAGKSDTDLNELGYRGAAPAMPKPQDEFRVAVLGGSTVFLGKPSLPQLIEEELHEAGISEARVYNFGVVASVSNMELMRLVHEVVDFDPDLVVFYNGANDITVPVLYDPRPGYPLNFYVFESNPYLGGGAFSVPAWLLSRSHLLRILFPGWVEESLFPLEKLRTDAAWGSDAWREEIAQIYVDNVDKAASVLRGRDVEFMGILQPMLYFKSSRTEQEQSEADRILAMLSMASPRSWKGSDAVSTLPAHSLDVRERIRARVAALDPRTAETFVDMSDFFDDDGEVFLDFVHLRPDAKPRLARAIVEHLLARPSVARRLGRTASPEPRSR